MRTATRGHPAPRSTELTAGHAGSDAVSADWIDRRGAQLIGLGAIARPRRWPPGIPGQRRTQLFGDVTERTQGVGDLVEPVVEDPLWTWLARDDETGEDLVLCGTDGRVQVVEQRKNRAGTLGAGTEGHLVTVGADAPPAPRLSTAAGFSAPAPRMPAADARRVA